MITDSTSQAFNETLWKKYKESKEYKKSKYLIENDNLLSTNFYGEISNKTKEIVNHCILASDTKADKKK